MNEKRQRANRFMYYADRSGNPNFFGGTSRAELIDALILDHEADRLNIPGTSEFARDWIDQQTNGAMTPRSSRASSPASSRKVGGEELLADIASQVRIVLARQEIAVPVVTPLDVFRNYRDQTERASFKVVPVVVDAFLEQGSRPERLGHQGILRQIQERPARPGQPHAGLQDPPPGQGGVPLDRRQRRGQADQGQAPEDELKAYYESRKKEFPMDGELPPDLFIGAPELTPPRYLPLSEIRDTLAEALAREKANEEIQETFEKVRDEYHRQVLRRLSQRSGRNRRRQEGRASDREVSSCPSPTTWPGVAKKFGLTHEITPLMDRSRGRERRPDLAGQGRIGHVERLERPSPPSSSTPRRTL